MLEHKSIILVVVDRLAKYAHFLAISHPYTAQSIDALIFGHIHKLHGLPNTNVNDRDPIFISTFWNPLFKLVGTKLAHTSFYHPQPEGQIERLNQCLENFIRCMTSYRPKQWLKWLAMIEWWYKTDFHAAL